ncbi:MAG: lipoprotein-releasing ABC transporter permease subunit [Gammaproteobacteria bacterium]|nr:lipoprotein-releasing ABC transporter permease subunit [Gammaproteobacteria bacterium]
MSLPLPLFIGLRYTRAKRRNHFISFISLTSMLGIALGVLALITVLSVMNGFEKELRERILGMAAHASISANVGHLSDWQRAEQQAYQIPEVVGAAPYIEGQVMMVNGQQVSGAVIRGVLPSHEPKVSEVSEKMKEGSLDDLKAGHFGIVLGYDLARFLGVEVGDKVTMVTPQANVTPMGVLPRLKRFSVVGIFQVGMYEYDRSSALIHIDDAARLLRMKTGEVTGVRLRLMDLFQAPQVIKRLKEELGFQYWITDWTQKNQNFFRAVKTEKTVMFVILALIVAVAAFNIVSTLVMVVTDKQADIAILRTLGLTPASTLLVFLVQGTLIGLIGTFLGVMGGVALSLNVGTLVPMLESFLGIQFLSPEVYYISELPSDLHWDDVVNIAMLSFGMTLLATIYPAWQASRVDPAEALRYE